MKKVHPKTKCEWCGEKFTPERAWQRFCSNKHRNDYHTDEQKRAVKFMRESQSRPSRAI